MNKAEKIAWLEEFAIACGEEVASLSEAFPTMKMEMQGMLAARVAELATENRTADGAARLAQLAAIRIELSGFAEQKLAEVKAERQRTVTLDEIRTTLQTFAKIAATGAVKEFIATKNEEIPEIVRREFAVVPELVKQEFATRAQDQTAAGKPNFASSFVGNWTTELELKRGDIFGYQGSSYICFTPSRGVVPARDNLTGANPRYGLLAARGAPGNQGLPGQNGSGGGGGISWSSAPANSSSSGAAGDIAYDSSYFYVCVATNTWRRTPIDDWA